MTTVTIDSRGPVHEITIKGHACYDLTGHDIVCSACSMLTYTLASSVTAMEEAGAVQAMTVELNAGDAYIRAVANENLHDSARLQAIIDTIRTGFQLLANKYPMNVQIVPAGGETSPKAE